MTYKEQLQAEVLAHTGVTLCRTDDEERVEQHSRDVADQLEYDFWTWSEATGLRCNTDASKTPQDMEAAELKQLPVLMWYLMNWTHGKSVVVAHDVVSTLNHKGQGGPEIARLVRTVVQLQGALNQEAVDLDAQDSRMAAVLETAQQDVQALQLACNAADQKGVAKAVAKMRTTADQQLQQYSVPQEDRVVQLVLCDSEAMPRPCGADSITMELPSRTEVQVILDEFATTREIVIDNQDQILDAVAGLLEHQIRKAILLAFVQSGSKLDKSSSKLGDHEIDVQYLQQYKRQALQAKGITWIDLEKEGGFDSIGGLEPLKQWLLDRAATFTPEAAQYGVEPAKGVIVAGPPGVAKSKLSSALAIQWNCPIISLDIGALRQKYHGESESNLRAALLTIDAISPATGGPCVVLIDEADRGLAGSTTSGDLDGGVAGRIFQTLATWMAERTHTSNAFLFFTSNYPTTLPAPLLRAGRLDSMFWIGFPAESERRAIVNIYKARYSKASAVDVEAVVLSTDKSTGATIEQAFKNAAVTALVEQRDITTEDVIQQLQQLPCAQDTFTMSPEMEAWKKSAQQANTPEIRKVDLTAPTSQQLN